jgi:hypothetical protein
MLSQLLTLYTTPVIYLFFDAAAKKTKRGHKKAQSRPQRSTKCN